MAGDERTEEGQALAEMVRSWLTRSDPVPALRARLDAGTSAFERADLRPAAEAGLLGLLLTDAGGTLADLAVVVEEAGRGLSPLPLAELAIAARLLEELGDDRAAAVADGSLVVVPVASAEPVCGLPEADAVVLVGPRPEVRPATELDIARRSLLDLSRSWGSVSFPGPPAGPSTGPVVDALALLRVVDAVGAADRLLEMTVRYVSEREQFGRPVGSFQAVKHQAADMGLQVAAAQAITREAAAAFSWTSPAEHARAVAAACAYAGAAAARVASTALQLHGGMGFTWEHDVHLLLRRAKTDELLDGTPGTHARRLVEV
ncbi:acyl-CoA dehydrogenase family protein [Sporichthya brevicatena]|uniref:Acyl-CoA dehydrogenase family protein n=1 Tax=Sporichthya brevicatena TaxID=171442 RepID=A0ABN1GQL6_9ACTN